MLKISTLIIALTLLVGCQSSLGIQVPSECAVPQAAVPDQWQMTAPPTIQLGNVYDKQLDLCSMGSDWFVPYQPVYHTANGTEMVRGFLNEPAFLSRNFMVESEISTSDGTDWLNADIEFALSRRFQVNGRVPLNLDESDIPYWVVGGRALLFDVNNLIVSTNIDFEFNSDTFSWVPTLNAWYDLGNHGLKYWALQTSVGGEFVEDDFDNGEFLWTGGLSTSFAAGTTGRWDGIVEGGYKDGYWQGSLGLIKPLDFLTHDLDFRSAVVYNFDLDITNLIVGLNWRF